MRVRLSMQCPITGKVSYDTDRDNVDIVLGEDGWVWVDLKNEEVVLYPHHMIAAVLMPKPLPKKAAKKV